MGKTSIEWTDASWNPIRGCSRVSEGCRNCYAERVAARFSGPGQAYEGLARMTDSGPRWTGEVRFIEEHLEDPLHWQRPRRIFVNSMSDLFHESVFDEDIRRIFAVMMVSPRHQFQVLTKRPKRMVKFFQENSPNDCYVEEVTEMRRANVFSRLTAELRCKDHLKMLPEKWPLSNVWLGVSVEDQKTADERIPLLLETPASVRWISAEPLLAPINFIRILIEQKLDIEPPRSGWRPEQFPIGPKLDWVVVGGESGLGARPMHPDWARSLREQCHGPNMHPTAFFFKQWGEWIPADHSVMERTPVLPLMDKGKHGIFDEAGMWKPDKGTFSEYENLLGHPMYRVGKKAAGRLLDGREWSEFPEVPA